MWIERYWSIRIVLLSLVDRFPMILETNEKIKAYIQLHREEDVRLLALKREGFTAEEHLYVLQQIEGWQIAKKKVPLWADCEAIVYPVHLSLEQCSSEETARYKQSIIGKGNVYADLTGGMGVDFSFMAKNYEYSYYVEQNEELCRLAQQNFKNLGVKNFEICHQTMESFLNEDKKFNTIFVDPARRDDLGKKVISIADCSPNLLEWKEQLLEVSTTIWIKYSPMLDISLAIKELGEVDELHVVSLNNECKELLFCLNSNKDTEVHVKCVNLGKKKEIFTFSLGEEISCVARYATEMGHYLYEPNASIMKAGAFKLLTEYFPVKKLSVNSHLYTSDEKIEQFPGRSFEIESLFSMNKKEIRKCLGDCKRANITVRNFPLTVNQLREKLKIGEGGDVYLFATTLGDKKVLVKTKKIV